MCAAPSDPFYSGSAVHAGVSCPDGRASGVVSLRGGMADQGRDLSVDPDSGDILYFIYCGPSADAG